MILLVLLDAMVAAEINLAALQLLRLRFIDGLARDRTSFIDCYRVAFFPGHLCHERLRVLVEFRKAAFAADIDILAPVLSAIFLTHWAAAHRAHFVSNIFLLGPVCRGVSHNRAHKHHYQEDGKSSFSHDFNRTPSFVLIGESRGWIIPVAITCAQSR